VVAVNRGNDVAVRTAEEPSGRPAVLAQPVAFVRHFEGGDRGSAIFVVDADGSGLRRLSVNDTWNDGSPAWSPDGGWIAFQSERDNPLRGAKRVTDIYLMRPDGSGVRRVTTTRDLAGPGNGVRHPAWSPGSDLLAVAEEDATDSSRILVIHPDGTGARAITEGPGDVGPAWSPDGNWIAFRRRPPGGDAEELWVVRPDGSDARRVVPRIFDAPIAWTPDSGRLTYAEQLPEGVIRLFTVELDGSGRRQVSAGPGVEDNCPVWSDDGALVVYSADPDRQYAVDREPGGPVVSSGGRAPGRLVVLEPGGVSRPLTDPAEGENDVSPSLGPADR
jgi:TolB protein